MFRSILVAISIFTLTLSGCQKPASIEWITTTASAPWTKNEVTIREAPGMADVQVFPDKELQTIEGFGSCFNELGWTSLNVLKEDDRESIMRELFSPGVGANFTVCRMPVGANDFALNWYSYDETEADFAMQDFSVENDRKTLIPFIKNALKYNPGLKIWASPWSPPTWMKYNKHYASRSSKNNDLPVEREGREGSDMFIQEDAYLKAYALYFQRFIEAYRKEDIGIFMVMPQNEFNSAQIFPSCCWTAKGLARFIGNYLGPAMEEIGVEIYFGTMERPSEALVDTVLQDDLSSKYIKGIGFQWAGKDALPGLNKKYPRMELYQTEQECGDGKNDWTGAMHSWELMKHYLNNGVSVYEYWNTSLLEGGISRWGWAQNSLVVVDKDTRDYRYTLEYYVMKHASHYVIPGAKRIETNGTYDDLLAFKNPDNSVVLIIANQEDEPRTVHLKIGDSGISPELEPHSLHTLRISM